MVMAAIKVLGALLKVNHPGRRVRLYQVSRLFAAAYSKAATHANAISKFSATSINPYNSTIFPDHLYAPSAVRYSR